MVESESDKTQTESGAVLDDDLISFEEFYRNYCVGIVDIVNSTKIILNLSQEKACVYFSVFLNTIGFIAQRHSAKIVKNIGDGILFYFPRESGMTSALECAIHMQESSEMINKIFTQKNIPKIQYRISLDYGPLVMANYATSSCKDIFGSTVNLCAKINRLAKPNGIVIGNDLYQLVKKSDRFKFAETMSFKSPLKNNYPVYALVETV